MAFSIDGDFMFSMNGNPKKPSCRLVRYMEFVNFNKGFTTHEPKSTPLLQRNEFLLTLHFLPTGAVCILVPASHYLLTEYQ